MLRIKLEFSLCDVIWGLEKRRERDITLKYVINESGIATFYYSVSVSYGVDLSKPFEKAG